MPFSPLGPLPNTNPLLSLSIQQFIDVLTGAMTDQPITIANTLTVTNTITASSNLTVSGTETVTGTLAASSNLTVAGTATVTGTIIGSSNATIAGTETVTGTLTASSNMAVTNTLTASSNVTVGGTETVTGTLNASSAFNVTNTLLASSGVTFQGIAAGDAIVTGPGGALAGVAAGAAGNVLTSSGGTWVSAAPSGVAASPITNSLGADQPLTKGSYTTGPVVAQGSSGTWWASGTVTFTDTAGAQGMNFRLSDGTTVIDSANTRNPAANVTGVVALSGYIANPSSNIRIEVNDAGSSTGVLTFNQSGNSKDCTLSAHRIA